MKKTWGGGSRVGAGRYREFFLGGFAGGRVGRFCRHWFRAPPPPASPGEQGNLFFCRDTTTAKNLAGFHVEEKGGLFKGSRFGIFSWVRRKNLHSPGIGPGAPFREPAGAGNPAGWAGLGHGAGVVAMGKADFISR